MASRREQQFVQGVIGNLALLQGVAPDHLAALARQSRALAAQRGARIARRGERLPGVFAVAYGSVKIAIGHHEERVLNLVSAGQTFGAATALLGRACDYEAQALVQTKLVVIPSAAIFSLIERDSRFAKQLVRALAERTLGLVAEIEATTVRRGTSRLAAYLASLKASGDGAPIELPTSKTLIAARLGIKKETLSRLLRQFADDGVIRVSRREVAVLDRGRLAALAGQSTSGTA